MTLAPYRELIRRGWIEGSNNIDVLEENVLTFLNLNALDDELPVIRLAARIALRIHTLFFLQEQ